ncbi:MAG: hypothetical protein ACD_38C00035G0011 [uncultured bacterium]|uniref:Fimbrial protein pilin n=1 Tax=Candidatus Daviesbacteria bacterium GW2011_GWC2_40_12 TaxID=1618431 RepID=A0A0G0TU48_9BACT|nr:MAG: hypothetical protein ACD_38C00035G0011 [uncultured bacterium]KKQ81652.1 MAG: fimbrial protein pilin [Candidatus Daviesbacteria bacterium GW2011_GWF2_38_7]KKR15615.1 MAG: fimbrial protein pilin [Candidatus Daviesbacteria bacterium GW2011_GWA2_39_33]KKR24385.1 MAG: fimbrial protein pilin [Candidatus Daviesbacteria bacterium GW2011_GWB1_39_5]KKR41417.1 MAG: fimbrial protein pilin [Candidatus Daviesbacteria bacterium GW2011_GWC2_40_12]OGE21026.1 MAG: hypothetical protein A2778_02215 [Candi
MPKSLRGFTLIELLVTVSIIAILATIGLIAYSSILAQGRDSKRQSDLRSIQSALEQYYSDQGFYPTAGPVGTQQQQGLNDLLASTTTPPPAFDSNTGNPVTSGIIKKYINQLPHDPAEIDYYYEAFSSNLSSCDNSTTNKCTTYCLYTQLESLSANDLKGCREVSTYNFALTPP